MRQIITERTNQHRLKAYQSPIRTGRAPRSSIRIEAGQPVQISRNRIRTGSQICANISRNRTRSRLWRRTPRVEKRSPPPRRHSITCGEIPPPRDNGRTLLRHEDVPTPSRRRQISTRSRLLHTLFLDDLFTNPIEHCSVPHLRSLKHSKSRAAGDPIPGANHPDDSRGEIDSKFRTLF